ncbi:MAG: ATP-binding protein, partial [Acidobacteriota bacterium]|nr:ATP-binding protein [Acidobacteriota bacterium]
AVLTGPRGNGKTALMRWFQHEIEAGKPAIDVVWMTPSSIRDLDALATELAPPGRFKGMSPDTLSVSIGLGRAGWKLGGGLRSLARLLAARCRAQPLVLLLDEAHTLDQAVGQPLLNVSQEVRSEAPFLLALAGTPGLAAKLNSLSTTFWDRGELIGVGRLAPAAAAEALTKPMAAQDPPISFTEAALGRVVESSQHYPYFLQLWGAALWNEARDTGAEVVDSALMDRVQPAVERRKTACYQNRYGEINRKPLLPAARAVADAFAGKSTLTENEFTRVIADSQPANTDPERLDALDADLRALGYVWIPPGSTVLEAGIPSLMDFVREKALAG